MSNMNPADLPSVSPEMLDWEFWEDLYEQPSAVVENAWDDEYDAIHGYGYDDYDGYEDEPEKVAVDDPEPKEDDLEELYDEFDDFDLDDEWESDPLPMTIRTLDDWRLWHATVYNRKVEIPFDIEAEFDKSLPHNPISQHEAVRGFMDTYRTTQHDVKHAERRAKRKKWNKPRRQERRMAARWRQERLAEFQNQDLMKLIRPVHISHLDLLDEDGF